MGALLSQAVANQLRQFPQGTPTPDQEGLQRPSIISDVMGRLFTPPGPSIPVSEWAMAPGSTRAERVAQAQQESQEADRRKAGEEQRIRDWYAEAQRGEHSAHSPVDQELVGTSWERQYRSYLLNYNSVVDQMNKNDAAFNAGKMSKADYEKAKAVMLPAAQRLDQTIRQLDAQRMQKARQMLKQMHGDFQI